MQSFNARSMPWMCSNTLAIHQSESQSRQNRGSDDGEPWPRELKYKRDQRVAEIREFLIPGYQHQAASIGESVIAFVLFIALLLTWIRPANTRLFGLVGQGFAFLGTLVGLFTIAMWSGSAHRARRDLPRLDSGGTGLGPDCHAPCRANKRAASHADRLLRSDVAAQTRQLPGALPWADSDINCRSGGTLS